MLSSEDREQVAKLMSEYLLQGFTMLDEHCFTCNTPLMKRRTEQQTICIYCHDIVRKRTSADNNNDLNISTSVTPMVSPEGTSVHGSVSTFPLPNNESEQTHSACKNIVKQNIGQALVTLSNELDILAHQLRYDVGAQRTQTYQQIGTVLKLIEPAIASYNSL